VRKAREVDTWRKSRSPWRRSTSWRRPTRPASTPRRTTPSTIAPRFSLCCLPWEESGCSTQLVGRGVYSEWLADRGATVTGIDLCSRMLELARVRLGGKASFVQADLGRPLDFLPSCSFDLVLSALTLDYLRDWDAVFREFFRVLREPGHLVFSAGHPSDEYYEHHPEGNYFEVEQVAYVWRGFGPTVKVPYYRRPL